MRANCVTTIDWKFKIWNFWRYFECLEKGQDIGRKADLLKTCAIAKKRVGGCNRQFCWFLKLEGHCYGVFC
jgi:hypothetical protein